MIHVVIVQVTDSETITGSGLAESDTTRNRRDAGSERHSVTLECVSSVRVNRDILHDSEAVQLTQRGVTQQTISASSVNKVQLRLRQDRSRPTSTNNQGTTLCGDTTQIHQALRSADRAQHIRVVVGHQVSVTHQGASGCRLKTKTITDKSCARLAQLTNISVRFAVSTDVLTLRALIHGSQTSLNTIKSGSNNTVDGIRHGLRHRSHNLLLHVSQRESGEVIRQLHGVVHLVGQTQAGVRLVQSGVRDSSLSGTVSLRVDTSLVDHGRLLHSDGSTTTRHELTAVISVDDTGKGRTVTQGSKGRSSDLLSGKKQVLFRALVESQSHGELPFVNSCPNLTQRWGLGVTLHTSPTAIIRNKTKHTRGRDVL
nr:MAG TPA: hypothetical protein [Caudoviricetes sp.]